MQFDKILEHHAFKSMLISIAATNQVAHAQLFTGPVGSANLALALAFATYLNCSAPKQSDACGSCFFLCGYVGINPSRFATSFS